MEYAVLARKHKKERRADEEHSMICQLYRVNCYSNTEAWIACVLGQQNWNARKFEYSDSAQTFWLTALFMLRHGARYKVSLDLVIIFTGIVNSNLSFIIHPKD